MKFLMLIVLITSCALLMFFCFNVNSKKTFDRESDNHVIDSTKSGFFSMAGTDENAQNSEGLFLPYDLEVTNIENEKFFFKDILGNSTKVVLNTHGLIVKCV